MLVQSLHMKYYQCTASLMPNADRKDLEADGVRCDIRVCKERTLQTVEMFWRVARTLAERRAWPAKETRGAAIGCGAAHEGAAQRDACAATGSITALMQDAMLDCAPS